MSLFSSGLWVLIQWMDTCSAFERASILHMPFFDQSMARQVDWGLSKMCTTSSMSLWAQHPIWMVSQAWVTGRIAACTLVLLQHRNTIRGCYVQIRSTMSVMLSGVGKSWIASRCFLHGRISELAVELPGWDSVGVRYWFRSANSAVFSLITNTNLSELRAIQYVSGVCIIWASHLPLRKVQ